MLKIVCLIPFLIFSNFALAEEIEEGSKGVYQQELDVDRGNISYIVDTKTQLCFMSYGGTTNIPCKALVKRPEWKKYISWL